jgi:hypothetical protein
MALVHCPVSLTTGDFGDSQVLALTQAAKDHHYSKSIADLQYEAHQGLPNNHRANEQIPFGFREQVAGVEHHSDGQSKESNN